MAEAALLLDRSSADEARRQLTRCCGSSRWVEAMMAARPYRSNSELLARAEQAWRTLERVDYLEAFSHHPEIGADLGELRGKFAVTSAWSQQEQAGAVAANDATLRALRDGNRAYRERFGYAFIVCATGKSAEEMLALLRGRLGNTVEQELRVAAAEQAKITRLRLEKLGS